MGEWHYYFLMDVNRSEVFKVGCGMYVAREFYGGVLSKVSFVMFCYLLRCGRASAKIKADGLHSGGRWRWLVPLLCMV